MELIQIAKEIENKIRSLELARQLLKERANLKAELSAEYDKQIAITVLKLRNGAEMELNLS